MIDTDFEACGALITDARKRAGKSIAQMGEELAIRPSYLEMLEKGELQREVGPGYFRSILLSCAEALKLDGERLLIELQSGSPSGVGAATSLPATDAPEAFGPPPVSPRPDSSSETEDVAPEGVVADGTPYVLESPVTPSAGVAPPARADMWEHTRRRVDPDRLEGGASDSTAYRVVMVVLLVLGIATAVLFALPLLGLVA